MIAVEPGPDGLVVRTRVGMAASDAGLLATYTWTADGDGLLPHRRRRARGRLDRPAAAARLRLALPAALDRVEWFGRGPGEAYRDTRRAARVGRFAASVDELQTPYVRPQENGNRTEVRWATLTDAAGAGLRVEGRPHFELTARRWTSEDLDAATHTPDLVAARPDLGQPRPRAAGHRHGLLRAGRAAPAPPRGRAGDLRAAPQSGIPFARVTCAYQRALSFGVRSSVSKST